MPIRPTNRSGGPSDTPPSDPTDVALLERPEIIAPPRRRPALPSQPEQPPTSQHEHGDYEVGYGKPPKHSQFKPGQSGNPRGRSKGARSLKVIAREVFLEKVLVRTADGERRIHKGELLVRKVVDSAIKGNARDAAKGLHLHSLAIPDEPATGGISPDFEPEEMSATDLATIAAFLARYKPDTDQE